jgi:hypothetical protein
LQDPDIEEGMTMFTIDKLGMYRASPSVGQLGHTSLLRAFAVDFARLRVHGTTPLVDNSGGANGALLKIPALLKDYPASGTNLAKKADFEAGLSATLDALAEIYAAGNAMADKLGIEKITFSPGAAADGTVAAVPVAVAGSATGPAAAGVNPVLTKINDAFYNAARLVSRVAAALDVARTPLTGHAASFGVDAHVVTGTLLPAIGAIATDTGAALGNGVTAAGAGIVLTAYRDNVHALAAVLIAAAADKAPSVLAID